MWVVTCKRCKQERTVRYSQYRYIQTGHSSGYCGSCALILNPPVRRRKNYKHSEATKQKIGASNSVTLKGRRPTHLYAPEIRAKISQKLTGRKLSPEHRLKCANGKIGKKLTAEHRKKLSVALKGEKGYWWRGGIAEKNNALRRTVEYKLWREAVFRRDEYKCRQCKVVGGRLNAHHIKPFALFPELRLSIDNGATLCSKCHTTVHSKRLPGFLVVK